MSEEQIAHCLAGYSVPPELGPKQEIVAKCGGKEFRLNRNFKVTPERIQDLLSHGEEIFPDQIAFLKPKKPVYDGEGMWEFQNISNGKTIKAKILDENWLNRFQNNELDPVTEFPYPQSILKVMADFIVRYDEAGLLKREEPTMLIKKVYGPVEMTDIPPRFFKDE